MNRIFFRVFTLAMLSMTVATVAIYFAVSYVFGNPLDEIARKQAAGPIFLLEQYIDHAPPDEWLMRVNKVREVSKFRLELTPLSNAAAMLPAEKLAELARGEIVLDVPGKSFYRRVDLVGDKYIGSADDVLLVSGLPIDVWLEVKVEALRYALVALFLLIPIALWSRAHWRELQALSKVAEAFGEGKLSTRAVTQRNASVYPLAQCMNRMADRIEGLLDAHASLLHSVSHELRTPISRLEFGFELLREATPDAAIECRIASLEADLAELNSLVSELLSLTRLEQQATQISRFVLRDLLQQTLASLAHKFEGKEVQVQLAENLGEIEADQRLAARAVSNLLVNAAKYANCHIKMSASREYLGIRVVVEDDGPGVPATESARVFEPFYRLDRSRDRTTGGCGLGLAIARKAIRLHGGDVTVGKSTLGGASFVIWLPVDTTLHALHGNK